MYYSFLDDRHDILSFNSYNKLGWHYMPHYYGHYYYYYEQTEVSGVEVTCPVP